MRRDHPPRQALGTPVSAATLNRIRATLRAALNAAIRRGLLADNPASRAELPRARRPRAVVWSPYRVEQWRRTGERLVRRFLEFTNEYPWSWGPSHVDEWMQALTSERRLAPSTIRGYQTELRLFSEYVCDGRYGWAAACEKEFGQGAHPVPVCHEWNMIAHLYGYEGNPEARPFTREVGFPVKSTCRSPRH